ncbi:MAG: hypothetical protein QME05_02695 [Candidatus Margulisbacteria bacterium]|nr:hypothetical protein [Candidatus Margulisiibacteriota bacterium]
MSTIDNFLSTHKVIFIVFAILILPFVLVWSLVYGVIVGIIGITVDRFESVRKYIRQDAIELLKYPKWKEECWKAACLRGIDMAEQRKEVERAFAEKRKKAPGMIGRIIQDILIFGIMLYPLLLIWGILIGPIRAFLECYKWCYKTWYGYSIYKGVGQ